MFTVTKPETAPAMPACPICDEVFEPSGLHPHLRSHDENELIAVVADVAKRSEQQPSQSPTTESTWHQLKTQKTRIAHQRNERDRKVNQHLKELNRQIKQTLQ
jgi:hypothetical protein